MAIIFLKEKVNKLQVVGIMTVISGFIATGF
jgi:drug/metabolite transporter (DMT)-like permease